MYKWLQFEETLAICIDITTKLTEEFIRELRDQVIVINSSSLYQVTAVS
jgi:hypothetical protein